MPKPLSFSNLNWLFVFLLLIGNLLLIAQNLQLRNTINDLNFQQRIGEGEKLGPIDGLDLNNSSLTLSFEGDHRKKIILFSSTSCPFCKKQNPFWSEFLRQVDAVNYEVIHIFRESEDKQNVAEYLKNNGLMPITLDPKVIFVKDEYLNKIKFNGTPLTIVVDEKGFVDHVWNGLWNKSSIKDMQSVFNIAISTNPK